jgi:Ser/Thr protein kinase RdoA (MazF antagonist)
MRCGSRLAELEAFLPGDQPQTSAASYCWLFGEMGRLHRDLARLDPDLPRGMAATWAPPGSLRRWLAVTAPALAATPAGPRAARLQEVVRKVRRRWIPLRGLPIQVIHGDFRPGNAVIDATGRTVLYDWGFANLQIRVHDLAYAAAFMVLAMDGPPVDRSLVDDVVACYEDARGEALLPAERAMLPVDAAAVMVFALAHGGYMADPVAALSLFLPFLDAAEWFLQDAMR